MASGGVTETQPHSWLTAELERTSLSASTWEIFACLFNRNTLVVFSPSLAFSQVKNKSCLCLNHASHAIQSQNIKPPGTDTWHALEKEGDHFRVTPVPHPHQLAAVRGCLVGARRPPSLPSTDQPQSIKGRLTRVTVTQT